MRKQVPGTRLTRWWGDHSLTIVLWVIGSLLTGTAFFFEPGRFFDLFIGLGQGTLTVALFYTLAGPLTERNMPEKK